MNSRHRYQAKNIPDQKKCKVRCLHEKNIPDAYMQSKRTVLRTPTRHYIGKQTAKQAVTVKVKYAILCD